MNIGNSILIQQISKSSRLYHIPCVSLFLYIYIYPYEKCWGSVPTSQTSGGACVLPLSACLRRWRFFFYDIHGETKPKLVGRIHQRGGDMCKTQQQISTTNINNKYQQQIYEHATVHLMYWIYCFEKRDQIVGYLLPFWHFWLFSCLG